MSTTATTKAVLLDFYGTMGESDWTATWFEELLTRHGVVIEPDTQARWDAEVFDGMDHAEHSQTESHYRTWMESRWQELLEGYGVTGAELDDMLKVIWDHRAEWRMHLYPEVIGVLEQLRGRGLQLAICSNWDWDLDRHLELTGVADLIDVRVSSAWVGCRKPHPRIFEATLMELGVEAGEALFVGDNWVADVEGPIEAGMRAVHIWRHDDQPPWLPTPPPLPEGVVRLRDLSGLLDLT